MAEVFLPAFTVAEWGGLHENIISAAKALEKFGHSVSVAVRDGLVAERAREEATRVDVVDWSNWEAYTSSLLSSDYKPDVIFTQPQKSREMALKLGRRWQVPVHLMVHGYYADGISQYERDITSVAGVSPRIVELLTGYANVPAWKVQCIPNGIDDEYFEREKASLPSEGAISVVLASRLESDKVRQIDTLQQVVSALRKAAPNRRVQIRVLGDGSAKSRFRDALSFDELVEVHFTGWLKPEDVALEMGAAFITVGAGRAAALSLALGTPCVAVGKHAACGLQYNDNLRIGLWSNFGDYPIGGRVMFPSNLVEDIASCLDPEFYESVSEHGRNVLYLERRQSRVDDLLCSFLSPRL